MSSCIFTKRWGYVNNSENEPISLYNATRKTKYYCPECNSESLLCEGKVRPRYFRHKSKTKCEYFETKGESIEHLQLKEQVKKMLDNGTVIGVNQKCSDCFGENYYSIKTLFIKKEETDYVKLEFISPNKKWVADVCVLDKDNNVKFIIEIKHTHKTENPRPEPWCEISTKSKWLDDYENELDDILCHKQIWINCCRNDFKCNCKKIYINCSYNTKNLIKSWGGKWDNFLNSWYTWSTNPMLNTILGKFKKLSYTYLHQKQVKKQHKERLRTIIEPIIYKKIKLYNDRKQIRINVANVFNILQIKILQLLKEKIVFHSFLKYNINIKNRLEPTLCYHLKIQKYNVFLKYIQNRVDIYNILNPIISKMINISRQKSVFHSFMKMNINIYNILNPIIFKKISNFSRKYEKDLYYLNIISDLHYKNNYTISFHNNQTIIKTYNIPNTSIVYLDINDEIIREEWYENNEYHRNDNNASYIEYKDRCVFLKKWYKNGKCINSFVSQY